MWEVCVMAGSSYPADGNRLCFVFHMTPTLVKPLRIAQVAPLFESVPPKLYGGTERVVSYLTEELVRQGHRRDALRQRGFTHLGASWSPCADRALRLDPASSGARSAPCRDAGRGFQAGRADFDVIHFHTDGLHYPAGAPASTSPTLTTLHGRLDLAELELLYARIQRHAAGLDLRRAARNLWPGPAGLATVHHGLPRRPAHAPHPSAGRYLAFIGRISPEKGRGSRHRHRAPRAGPAQDRGQGGSRRSWTTSGSTSSR